MDHKQQLNFDVRIIGIEVCFNYSDNEIYWVVWVKQQQIVMKFNEMNVIVNAKWIILEGWLSDLKS